TSETEQSVKLAGDLAMQHIAERAQASLGTGDLAVRRVLIDDAGAHVRVGQTIGGVPVFEGEAIVHMGPDGLFDSITDRTLHDLKLAWARAVAERDAVALAVIAMGGHSLLAGKPAADLQILRRDGVDHLTYRVQLEMRNAHDEPMMPVVFVDAHTSKIV